MRASFDRNFSSLLLGLTAIASSSAFAVYTGKTPLGTHSSQAEFVEGEVIVKFKENILSVNDRVAVLSRHASSKMKLLSNRGAALERVKIEDGMSVEKKIQLLQLDPDVESAQPNYIYHTLTVPSSTKYPQNWALKNTGQSIVGATYGTGNPGTAGKDLDVETAWTAITDCSAVKIAVIDTGVNYNHVDLIGSMWNGGVTYPNHGYDFIRTSNDPMDLNGHGTHVAGIIGGTGANTNGITGVCWKSNIMALRALDATGSGTTSDIVLAINFAVANSAKVISMSLGQKNSDASMNTALTNASNAGIAIIVAAGNDGANNDSVSTPTFPCNSTVPNLVCVAALDQKYALATFSNYGASSVDIGAPGTNIQSAFAGSTTTLTDSFNTAGTLNWTVSGGAWTYGTRTLSDGTSTYTMDMLLNPSNWNGTSTKYANNLDARIYKTFNLAGVDAAVLNIGAFVDVAVNDHMKVYTHTAAGDPITPGIMIADYTNDSTAGTSAYLNFNLDFCHVATCSLGFQFTSSAAAATTYGAALYGFNIKTLTLNTNSYKIENGTSMATPFVSGMAAMLFAYNPNYTAEEVVAALKNGGVTTTALSGKTTMGKAASASGSLKYISPPSSVTVSVQ